MIIMISDRLRQLRVARGLSLEALAAEMGGVVTKQALSKYEHGRAFPSPSVLNKLAAALGVKSVHLWTEPTVSVKFIAYRKGYGLGKREQERVESLVAHDLEKRVEIQMLANYCDGGAIPVQALTVNRIEDAEQAADSVRDLWALGFDPISSVTGVLEDHCVHVFDIVAGEKFDGLSAVASVEGQVKAAAIVSRRGVAGERQRLNLAHELGHTVLNVAERLDEEKAAFRFGAAFLAPRCRIHQEVGSKRTFIQLDELLLLKQRFGMSIQALLYRLRDLAVISETHYRDWCIDINRLGWRKKEPAEWPPEHPQWLHQNVLRAVAEEMLTRAEGEALLGRSLEDGQSLPLIEKRAFMKLPMEKRRKLLVEQAEKVVDYYTHHNEWVDFQGGDIIEC